MQELIEKVLIYITSGNRLLVFKHTQYPEAGIQVPAGTLKPDEDPVAGALREALEETGLEGMVMVGRLGVDDFDQSPYGIEQTHRRYFYHMSYEGEVVEHFTHFEKFPSDGSSEEFEFEYWWASIPDEVPWLIAGQGRFLPELCQDLGLPAGELEYQAQFSVSWSEANTEVFLAHGRYFVPEREQQIEILRDLLPIPARIEDNGLSTEFRVLDLGCGEGLVAEAILERYPQVKMYCYDGSWNMLRTARLRLERFGDRVILRHFELTATEWRKPDLQLQGIISSLAIHHLDNQEKRVLFADLIKMLLPGGAVIIADIIQPAEAQSLAHAADSWDEEVLRRALELDGNDHFYQQFRQQHWNIFRYPDPMDKPSGLLDQLQWMQEVGFIGVDVYWLKAGHAIWGGHKPTWEGRVK